MLIRIFQRVVSLFINMREALVRTLIVFCLYLTFYVLQASLHFLLRNLSSVVCEKNGYARIRTFTKIFNDVPILRIYSTIHA